MTRFEREPRSNVIGLLIFAALSVVIGALGACSPFQISDRSIDFNGSLQDLDNRQVLLNAVRASKRYPPYFTSVNQISSSGELDGSQVNFTLPFGPQNHNIYSASPMIKFSTGITLQTNPLDTQEFYQGYMTPVKTDLIGYYLDYGWPRQLILHVFLREIDLPKDIVEGIKFATIYNAKADECTKQGAFVVLIGEKQEGVRSCLDNLSDEKPIHDALRYSAGLSPGSLECSVFTDLNRMPANDLNTIAKQGNTITRFINDPTNRCRFAAFQLLVAMLDKLELTVVSVPPPAAAGPKPITIPTADKHISIKLQSDTSPSVGARVNFALNKVENPCIEANRLKAKPSSAAAARAQAAEPNAPFISLATAVTGPGSVGPPLPPDAKVPNPAPLATKNEPLPPLVEPPTSGPRIAVTSWQATLCKDEGLISIVPRSAEAIVFYLGQLINAEYPRPGEDPPFIALVRAGRGSLPLFDVKKGLSTAAGRAEVSVTVDGETYSIPRSDEYNSTMHTLTLVEQVIALQKKGTQIPGIIPVQVINP